MLIILIYWVIINPDYFVCWLLLSSHEQRKLLDGIIMTVSEIIFVLNVMLRSSLTMIVLSDLQQVIIYCFLVATDSWHQNVWLSLSRAFASFLSSMSCVQEVCSPTPLTKSTFFLSLFNTVSGKWNALCPALLQSLEYFSSSDVTYVAFLISISGYEHLDARPWYYLPDVTGVLKHCMPIYRRRQISQEFLDTWWDQRSVWGGVIKI